MSANQWMLVIDKIKKKAADDVPSGWKTRRELEELWSVGTSQANRYINEMMKSDLIEAKKFRIGLPTGTRAIQHYKIK